MIRIVAYAEYLKRGAGKFVRDLGENFLLVKNSKTAQNSIAVMRADTLVGLLDEAERVEEATEVRTAMEEIKRANTEKYRNLRQLRKIKEEQK